MSLIDESINELFILIIKLIPNATHKHSTINMESQLIFPKESSQVFVSQYE